MASKMYILVRESMREKCLGHSILSVAHASAAAVLDWQDAPEQEIYVPIREWAKSSFRKVLCIVSDEQFEKAKSYGVSGESWRVMTESALENQELSLVFRPREQWPDFFRSLKLWKE